MLQNNFTCFITIDNNFSFQQNFKNYPLKVIVISTYETIMEIFQNIIAAFNFSSQNITAAIHPKHSSFQ